MRDLRIVFMGTPDFAVGVLKKLVESPYTVAGVVTATDKPAGRGQKLSVSAVKQYALSQDLPVLQPTSLKNEVFLDELKALRANLQIVVAFRMLPKVVWDLPKYGTFNLHASLLPKYRGAAPINWAIINGETETGVTTFFIDQKIDTGAIIASKKTSIVPSETAGSLHDKLMVLGSELVLETVAAIAKGPVATLPQPKDEVFREAPKLTPNNTQIDWSVPIATIDHFIRGLCPYPTAWTQLKNGGETYKVKVYRATTVKEHHKQVPGSLQVSKKEIKVAAKDGYVLLEELQLPGKKKMKAIDLLNGFSFQENAQFV